MQIDEVIEQLGLAPDARAIVAIDGPCCSGKTTLAGALAQRLHAAVFHMDDFFLQPPQRTAARLAVPGENVDHERFLTEVLLPLSRREDVALRRYDCATQALLAPVAVPYAPLTIVEGSYSLHPALFPYYDRRIVLTVDPALQRARILLREGAHADRFFSLWLPLEQAYFQALRPETRADLVLDGGAPTFD